jgi:hypothetical protein
MTIEHAIHQMQKSAFLSDLEITQNYLQLNQSKEKKLIETFFHEFNLISQEYRIQLYQRQNIAGFKNAIVEMHEIVEMGNLIVSSSIAQILLINQKVLSFYSI